LTVQGLMEAGFRCRPGSAVETRREAGEPGLSGVALPAYLQRREKALIVRALEENRWVQKDAAHQLGISPRMLHYKIRKMNLRPVVRAAPEE